MSDKPSRKALLLSLAFGLATPLSGALPAAADQTPAQNQAPTASAAPPQSQPPAATAAPPQSQPPAVTAAPVQSQAPAAGAVPGSSGQAADKAVPPAAEKQEEPAAKSRHKKTDEESAPARHVKDSMSDNQRRHEDQGYYSGTKGKADQERFSDNQRRHGDEGYYTDVRQYAPPPPEEKPVAPPVQPAIVTPPPLIVPPVGSGQPNDRKLGDDTGATGSITATRHAKQAKDMLNSGHYDLAKSHFRESLQQVPSQLDLYPGYWESCAKTNDWGEARRALEKFFELDSAAKKDYYWAYGQTWFELRNYDKAVPVLREALGYGQHVDDVHADLLKIALNRKDSAGIAAEYAAVLKSKPSDAKTHKEFADWLEVQGRHSEAIAHYKSAVGIDPSDGATAGRLAYMMMFYNKDFHGAINYYQKAVAGDPLNAAKYLQSIEYAKSQIQTSSPKKKQEQQ